MFNTSGNLAAKETHLWSDPDPLPCIHHLMDQLLLNFNFLLNNLNSSVAGFESLPPFTSLRNDPLILKADRQSQHYCLHFTDEKTDTQRGQDSWGG